MKEKMLILFFLILAFGMCGNGSSIEVNEPVKEDLETDVNNLEATEKPEETAQTDTNNSDSVSKEKPVVTIENIKPIDHYGTSSHLEIVDDSTLRLFYNDFDGVVVFLCSYDFDCETQGTIRFITDLTLIETLDGERRGYFVEMNPNTMESGIYTAKFSEDGLTYTEKTPLGITAREDEVAWGVPDTVVMPNGLIRVYWVYTEDKKTSLDPIGLTYWMNSLQPIPESDPMFVTLNSKNKIDPYKIYDEATFMHPVYDLPALKAQKDLAENNGKKNTWFCGAWMKNGFHEDGLASAIDVVAKFSDKISVKIAAQ